MSINDLFGDQITREKADIFFNRFFQIKKRTFTAISNALEKDPEALRYFCGRNIADPSLDDWAYLFNKESLKRIMATIDSGKADGMMVFHGVRSKEDSPKASEDVDGRPTLMLFPVKTSNNGKEMSFQILSDDGEEHPGTGGGVNGLKAGEKLPLPDEFGPGSVRALF